MRKGIKEKGTGKGYSAPPRGAVIRLKVTLQEIMLPIWRQIEVPAFYTFWELHVAIQDAMGWTDSHLHVFRVSDQKGDKVEIGLPNDEALTPIKPGWEHMVLESLVGPGSTCEYEYDFGDSWMHEILLEEVHPRVVGVKYPRCIAGARACPPEDCGSSSGYEELVNAMQKPGSEQYKDFVRWLGHPYDPEAFDPAAVRFMSPKKRLRDIFEFGGLF